MSTWYLESKLSILAIAQTEIISNTCPVIAGIPQCTLVILPVMFAPSPQVCGPQASGIHIRQILHDHAHVTLVNDYCTKNQSGHEIKTVAITVGTDKHGKG